MLKSEKILLATTMLAATIGGGAFLLSLTPEEQKETIAQVEPIMDRNPLAPLLVNLGRPKEADPALFINVDPLEKQTGREVIKNVAAHIPVPPHRPRIKQAYLAIAAHMKAEPKEPEAEKPQEALAYAPQENPLEKAVNFVRNLSFTPASTFKTQPGVAVYKITDHKVYLPNGETIEAHSGLGPMRDNPRYTHVKMRGPTPPHIYNLSWRERPFHGVKAIRLTPLGGASAIHNRDGLLAHTYMLNPEGASNGCVSFRDYTPFQRAFERGEIQKLAVVP